MACTNDKFVINKGMSNEFILTIKQNDSTLPMLITDTDTFTLKMYKLEDSSEVTGLDNVISVYDANNGQIKITLDSAIVSGLVGEKGGKEDRYYLRPTYRIAIDCNTINNGAFVAKIPLVYVEK